MPALDPCVSGGRQPMRLCTSRAGGRSRTNICARGEPRRALRAPRRACQRRHAFPATDAACARLRQQTLALSNEWGPPSRGVRGGMRASLVSRSTKMVLARRHSRDAGQALPWVPTERRLSLPLFDTCARLHVNQPDGRPPGGASDPFSDQRPECTGVGRPIDRLVGRQRMGIGSPQPMGSPRSWDGATHRVPTAHEVAAGLSATHGVVGPRYGVAAAHGVAVGDGVAECCGAAPGTGSPHAPSYPRKPAD